MNPPAALPISLLLVEDDGLLRESLADYLTHAPSRSRPWAPAWRPTSNRCRPWRAKRRPVVPGRRRRGRLAGVAEGRSPEAAEARCKRIRYAVKPFDGGPWRSPTAPLGARRDGAVARSGANRGTRVVAERKAKGGLGSPVSHPEHGDTPMAQRDFAIAIIDLGLPDQDGQVLVEYLRHNYLT